MTTLILGLAVFAGVHLFSMLLPATRDRLEQHLGERRYKGLYSLISLAAVALIVWGYHVVSNGPWASDVIYEPAAGNRHITMLLVLLAFISLASSGGKGYIARLVRQPMSVGFALWAVGHLLSNGRRYDLYIFGTILVLALLDIVLSTARGKLRLQQPTLRADVIAVVAGVVLYAVFLFGFHPYVLGIPIVG
jgi:uncharacterized membrane protein